MASLITSSDGVRLIQFRDNDARPTIRLGRIDKKTAGAVLLHVERLISAKHHRQPLPNETAAWLDGIGDKLHGRLVRAGAGRAATCHKCVHVRRFDRVVHLARAGSVEAATVAVWKRARDMLCERFGESTPATPLPRRR